MKRIVAIAVAALVLSSCGGRGETSGPLSGGGGEGSYAGPLQFVLEPSYTVGEQVDVRLENVGEETYVYNAEYQACDLTYRDSAGREFIIPPGTHCDLVLMQELRPGETVKLFSWNLSECVEDQWGCVKEEPLEPGRYTISGRFEAAGKPEPARAEATFEIVDG